MSNCCLKNDNAIAGRCSGWGRFLLGMIAGGVIAMVVVLKLMPSAMIVTEESRLGFDETVAALEKAIVERGWVVSGVQDMNKSMAKHGVEFGPRVTLIKLCHPEYAKSVLTTDRHVASMMPCSIAVWQDDGGNVRLSKMNIALMAKIFGGNVAEVMGGKVAADEKAIVSAVVKK